MSRILLNLIGVQSPSEIPDPPVMQPRLRVRLEWKPADLWVGLFVKKEIVRLGVWNGWRETSHYHANDYHLWICLLPMLPIHIIYHKRLP